MASSRMAVWGSPPVSTHDAIWFRKCAGSSQQALVFFGVDVIGDHDEVVVLAHGLHSISARVVLPEPTGPPTPRAAEATLVRPTGDVVQCGHDRNSQGYWVSCWALRMASMGVKSLPLAVGQRRGWFNERGMASMGVLQDALAALWPRGTALMAA